MGSDVLVPAVCTAQADVVFLAVVSEMLLTMKSLRSPTVTLFRSNIELCKRASTFFSCLNVLNVLSSIDIADTKERADLAQASRSVVVDGTSITGRGLMCRNLEPRLASMFC